MLAVYSTSVTVHMIVSLGSDGKVLALSSLIPHVKLEGGIKESTPKGQGTQVPLNIVG